MGISTKDYFNFEYLTILNQEVQISNLGHEEQAYIELSRSKTFQYYDPCDFNQ